MVVDYLSMSSVNFAIPDFCSLIPNVLALAGNFLSTLHWKGHRAPSCSFKMISFSNINKQYGKQLLFVDASFQLNPGEKVGLVGPNGSGKTTLFRMVVGEETPDEGTVSVPKKLTIGYFRQDVEEMQGRSVLDEAIAGSGRVGDLHHELEALQREMSDPDKADDMDRILDRFGHVQEEYEHLGGYTRHRCALVSSAYARALEAIRQRDGLPALGTAGREQFSSVLANGQKRNSDALLRQTAELLPHLRQDRRVDG